MRSLWGYARDDRPWGGPLAPAVVYLYAEDRKGKRPREHLESFAGTLQVDAYAGFNALADPGRPAGPVTLAFCWAHSRRKFFEVHKSMGSPIAAEVLRRIAELYVIEDRMRGKPAELRAAIRNAESRPLVEALKSYIEEQLGRLSRLDRRLSRRELDVARHAIQLPIPAMAMRGLTRRRLGQCPMGCGFDAEQVGQGAEGGGAALPLEIGYPGPDLVRTDDSDAVLQMPIDGMGECERITPITLD